MTRRCSGIPEFKLRLDRDRCIPGQEQKLTTPDTAVRILRSMAGDDAQESFIGIFVAPNNTILGTQRVSVGGFAHTSVDPKALFGAAILSGASAIIVGHNHPSGDVQPSAADDEMTQQLLRAGQALTLKLLDHIVFSRDDYFSYVASGRLKFS